MYIQEVNTLVTTTFSAFIRHGNTIKYFVLQIKELSEILENPELNTHYQSNTVYILGKENSPVVYRFKPFPTPGLDSGLTLQIICQEGYILK